MPSLRPQAPPTQLLTGATLNVGGRVATLALGLALLVVVARQGPAVQGAFALFVTVEGVLVALSSGLGLALAREVGDRGAAPPAARHAALRLAAATGALLALPLLAWSQLADAPPYTALWVLALAAPAMLWIPTASGLWLGQGRLLEINGVQAGAPALTLVLLGVLLAVSAWRGHPLPPVAVLWAWAAARAILGLACALSLRGDGGVAATRVPDAGALRWTPPWRFVGTVALGNVVSLLNLRATLFIVEHYHGLAAAGIYSAAVQVAELLWVLSAALSTAAYARLRGDTPAAAALAWQAARLGWAVTALVAPLLGALAWWVLPWALGSDYAAARGPLLVLLPGVVAYAGASAISAFYTQALGRPQWAAGVAALSLSLTLAIAWIAVPRWGAAGAAVATSTAYALALGLVLPSVRRRMSAARRK